MGLTNYQFGISSFGIPQIGNGCSIPSRNAKVLFVDSTLGAAGGIGDIDSPYSTIQAAIDAIENSSTGYGSTIFVFPGTYDENLVVAGDGISIIGCVAAGYERPDVVPTAGVALTVTGQGFFCAHMRFAGNTSDTVIQNGNGFVYRDCVFDGDAGQAATEGCLRLVGLAADDSYTASEGLIEDCLFRGSTSGAGIIIQHAANPSGVGCSDNVIRGCTFVANGVDFLSAVNVSGGGAGIFLNTTIEGNKFLTVGAAYVYFDMDQGAAGDLAANSALISNNWFADEALIAAQVDVSGQANVMVVGNWDCAGVVDGSTFNN